MRKFIYTIFAFILLVPAALTAQEKKELSEAEYKERKDKLKELHIKQIHSESYANSQKKISIFLENMNYNYPEDVKGDDEMIAWLTSNLAKTNFDSLEQAKAAWKECTETQMKEMEENKEYYDYMFETLGMTDSKILSDVMMEVMMEYPEKAMPGGN